MGLAPLNDGLDMYRGGSTEPWTADLIAAIVSAKQPYYVIETGTYEGLTTRRIFNALEANMVAARFVTIEMDRERADAVARQNWDSKYGVGVVFMHGDALAMLREAPDNCADIIFLDDDHDAEHVGREAREAMRVLRTGGILLMHDVVGHFRLDGIVKALGGVILDLPRLHAAGGLGIVTK